MYYADKPKVFVRFFPGASGNFFSLLLHSLVEDVNVNRRYVGHIYSTEVHNGHNFNAQYGGGTTEGSFQYHTRGGSNLNSSILYIRNKFRFTKTENQLYSIPTHAMDPKSLMFSFPPHRYNSKLINISITPEDKDQIYYNMVTKDIIPNKKRWLMELTLDFFRMTYPEKMSNPKFDINRPDFYDDERFIFYLCKFNSEVKYNYYDRWRSVELGDGYDYLDIPFSSLGDMSLVSKFKTITDYIGLPLTKERMIQSIIMLKSYKSAQQQYPYGELHIDDY